MSIIFFRFFLLFSVVANRVGPKTRYHRACSRSLTSLVLSRSLLRYCTKLCLLGFSAISASFSRNFSGLWAGLGSCFVDFYGFSYFFLDFFRLMDWFWELFWGFLRFQLLFHAIFSGLWAEFESCFGDFCGFSYFSRIFSGLWAEFWELF